ncbi:MAG: hypothetical protein KN64_09490 [Sulfurovum sp. AS07-7]|nr:MAG: hypothetical protein KN64_09490 [Sulfurovum sp. AS07-7]
MKIPTHKTSCVSFIKCEYCVVYKSDSQTFYIMDSNTYNSAYIQMFLLGNYDKNLFELVVSSPYSKVYKLKR